MENSKKPNFRELTWGKETHMLDREQTGPGIVWEASNTGLQLLRLEQPTCSPIDGGINKMEYYPAS